MGESDINGTLPVTIPGIAKRGTGINLKSINKSLTEHQRKEATQIKQLKRKN